MLKDMKIGHRLAAGFGAVAGLFAITILIAVFMLFAIDETSSSIQDIRSVAGNVRMLLSLMGLFAISLSIFISNWIGRGITRPLKEVSDANSRMAEGDLTVRVDYSSRDEVGLMVGSMNSMIADLKSTVSQTRESAGQVSAAAGQIASANQNFSQRITEQAAAIEETSATMEEMAASIRQTADNAKEADRLAQATKTSTEIGSVAMQDTIDAMEEINKSSGRIANISHVIDEIAFQTNLLALNAAVEAARAGEHGKGFAVVAAEIRSLAQRSSQSAKEINALIEDSVTKAGKGAQLAKDLGKKLEEIWLDVNKVTDIMAEVSTAAQEQAEGIGQANTAISQIDQATQQNASIIEETAATTEELSAQAKGLLNLIAFFKVGDTAARYEPHPGKMTVRDVRKQVAPRSLQVAGMGTSNDNNFFAPLPAKSNGGFEEF